MILDRRWLDEEVFERLWDLLFQFRVYRLHNHVFYGSARTPPRVHHDGCHYGVLPVPASAKKKAKTEGPPPKTEPTVQVHSNLNPERAIKSMPGAYTVAEAKNHVRIVQDCLNIFEKTKNLETFFSRYEYGMQIALTVDQAAKAGIIPYTSDLPASFFKAADSQKERVLLDSYSDQKAKIDELKTAKAKATHWNRYLNTLKEYEDQYSMNPDSEYPEVLEQVKGELDKLDLSTSVPPPEA